MTELLASILLGVFLVSTLTGLVASRWLAGRLRAARRLPREIGRFGVGADVPVYADGLPRVAAPGGAEAVRRHLYARAAATKQGGDYPATLRLLEELLAWDPTPAERALAHLEMGDCFAERGNLPEAELHYREAHALSVAHDLQLQLGAALRNLSRVARLRGELDSALQIGERALHIHRDGNHRNLVSKQISSILLIIPT